MVGIAGGVGGWGVPVWMGLLSQTFSFILKKLHVDYGQPFDKAFVWETPC